MCDDDEYEEESSNWYDSEFAHMIAQGFFILCLCIGIGTCQMLTNVSNKPDIDQNKIENTK
jgi:hypothetical protein